MTDSSIKEAIEASMAALDQEKEFELTIGRLTIAWAEAESQLYKVLVHYAQVSDGVARAIFSGTRASTMMQFIDAIAHNTNMEEARRKDLEFVFAQMSAINTMRDRLVHNYTLSSSYIPFNDKQRAVTNVERAARYGKHFEHIIDIPTLECIWFDLHAILMHLERHCYAAGTFRPFGILPGEPTTWSYKPPQPANKQGKSPKVVHK